MSGAKMTRYLHSDMRSLEKILSQNAEQYPYPAEETPKLKGFELIDDFIEKSESDSPLCMKPLREEMPSSPTSSDELTEEETMKEEEDSFLRTLETGIRLLDKTMAP